MNKNLIALTVCILLSMMSLMAQKEKFLFINAGYQMPIIDMKDLLNNGIGINIRRMSYSEKMGGTGIGLGFYSFSPKTINIDGYEFKADPYTLITLSTDTELRIFGNTANTMGFILKVKPAIGYRISESSDEAGKFEFLANLGLGPRFKIFR